MANRDIALALSGGGYRAGFFHLGVLRKLHELNLLDRLGVISCVSGGSIVGAAYARAVLREGGPLSDAGMHSFIVSTRDFMLGHTLDVPAILRGVVPWRTSARHLERTFALFLKGSNDEPVCMSALGELDGPLFVFNSTAIHSGRGWRFISGGLVEEWELGQTHNAAYSPAVDRYRCDVTLAKAVTASSAFPFFSAVTIPRSEFVDIGEDPSVEHRHFFQDLPDPVSLSDGGVRDNTGLLSILIGCQPHDFESDYYLIGSDAGSVVDPLGNPPSGFSKVVHPGKWLRANPRGRMRKINYLLRQFEIRGHHNNRLIIAMMLREHRLRRPSMKGAAVLRIDESMIECGEMSAQVGTMMRVKTRLKSPGWNLARKLMNHGSNLLWGRVSEYTDLLDDRQRMSHTRQRSQKDICTDHGIRIAPHDDDALRPPSDMDSQSTKGAADALESLPR